MNISANNECLTRRQAISTISTEAFISRPCNMTGCCPYSYCVITTNGYISKPRFTQPRSKFDSLTRCRKPFFQIATRSPPFLVRSSFSFCSRPASHRNNPTCQCFIIFKIKYSETYLIRLSGLRMNCNRVAQSEWH